MFMINSKVQVLLQKRSANKKLWPNMWDMTAGGHVLLQLEEVSEVKRFEKEDIVNRIKNNFDGITEKGGCWDYLIKYYEWKDSKTK